LKSFIRCKRKAWLDFKGNKSLKNWSAHKSIEKINQYHIFHKFCKGDLYSGLKACERASKGVIGFKAKNILIQNIYAETYPQLLVKTIGKSKWGNYKYIPAVYKLGRKTTREHLFELAFNGIILEVFQESKIEKGLVITDLPDADISFEEISLNKKLRKKVLDVFISLNQSLEGWIPEMTEDRKKCSICSWQNYCNKEAKKNGSLTDIDGIGSKTALLLKDNGIYNIQKLASLNEVELGNKLSKFNHQKYEKALKFINQAESYISGNPIENLRNEDLSNLLSKKNSGFFVFDIESNPDEKHDFLYGFLKLNNLFEEIEHHFYEPILNIKKNNKESYRKIMNKLCAEKNWPILHYGETEKIAIISLARKLNYDSEKIELLKSRFIDLHTLIRKSWILPIKNYSLKTVANWMGFEWEQKNANGSKALYWWIQYKITRQNVFLKKIIKYNKDDCLATLHIAKWLIKKQGKN